MKKLQDPHSLFCSEYATLFVRVFRPQLYTNRHKMAVPKGRSRIQIKIKGNCCADCTIYRVYITFTYSMSTIYKVPRTAVTQRTFHKVYYLLGT